MPRHHPYGGYDDNSRGRRHRRGGGGGGRSRGRGPQGGDGGGRMNYGGGSYGIQGGGGNAFPSWGMPPPMMPMPYGMPYPMFSMPDASGMPMPSPYAGMYGGPSPGAMPPMHWDAMYAPYLSPNGRADASGGGSGRGRGSGRPDRKSQRSRFSRSIYQPDPNAERPEDSKPCRTLFVRNVAFEVNVNALRAEFASFGEVRTWFDLIQRRGMLFVSYYDTRAAERARVTMNQKVYVGRTLDVHFSLPKDEDQEQHCDRDKNQGTLFVDVKDALEPITDEAFRAHFEQFGEIRAIRTYKDQSHTRFVEYWDSRACVKAHDTCQDSKFAGGTMQVKFAWDLSTVSLVNDARTRSEAKAAAEARARQNQQGVPVPGELASLPQATSDATPEPPSETHTSSLAAAKQLEDSSASATETDSQSPMASSHLTWCTNEPSGAAPEARLEQAQRVQQLLASLGSNPTNETSGSHEPIHQTERIATSTASTSEPDVQQDAATHPTVDESVAQHTGENNASLQQDA